MPEDRKNQKSSSDIAADGLERLAKAAERLESLLTTTLADYDALNREHQKLKLDYQALEARTHAVGAQMDETIGRLKNWIASDGAPESEGATWAK